MVAADVLLALGGVYAGAGALFGVAFVTRGAARIDPAARDAGVIVRAFWLPAAAALWPLLILRWVRS